LVFVDEPPDVGVMTTTDGAAAMVEIVAVAIVSAVDSATLIVAVEVPMVLLGEYDTKEWPPELVNSDVALNVPAEDPDADQVTGTPL
jgi:hypothetical protein